MPLIRVENWPEERPPEQGGNERWRQMNNAWCRVVYTDLRRAIVQAEIPGITHESMVSVVFGAGQFDPDDKTVYLTVEIRPNEQSEDTGHLQKLAVHLGYTLKERLENGWRTVVFIHRHRTNDAFWAG